LIKKRWVLTVGDLGYIVPADAVVAGVITTTITQDAQWDKYILFWAERLAQVDIAATGTSIIILSPSLDKIIIIILIIIIIISVPNRIRRF
jgi:hypothetical protein